MATFKQLEISARTTATIPEVRPSNGKYEFTNADLSTIKGIAGILSSKGEYSGELGEIIVDGTTDTPDFRLTISGHPVPLHTEFHAIVDGTNGDTYLQPVDATLLHSHIVARGSVVRSKDRNGHHIVLDAIVDKSRIEDLLHLGVRTDPPVMTGSVQLKSKIEIPPGNTTRQRQASAQGQLRDLRCALHYSSDAKEN